MSAHQLHRMLDVTYKTAWFMAHRIRESMTDAAPSPIGGADKVIEADETYVGARKLRYPGVGAHQKKAVALLVERSKVFIESHLAAFGGCKFASQLIAVLGHLLDLAPLLRDLCVLILGVPLEKPPRN